MDKERQEDYVSTNNSIVSKSDCLAQHSPGSSHGTDSPVVDVRTVLSLYLLKFTMNYHDEY